MDDGGGAIVPTPLDHSKWIRLDSGISARILPDHQTENSPPAPLALRDTCIIVITSLSEKTIGDQGATASQRKVSLSDTIQPAICPPTM
ncbi:hypothetical protein CA13_29410 [Planctomycetes bacterium CA13]|uniref:Uncharacterized protein n=1 Tax=Novipirellula herctigrandis TaxID=2527986 RepID=A0A5C5Z2D2_9BACT|nr:hypothetical protein CA13_29410 [Planctomycetes bacterium CA13]